MHIQDGVLPVGTLIGGYALAGCWIGATIRKLDTDDMPKLAVMSSAFFVASLIHVKLPGSSVHLLLHGLVGIILGVQAPLGIALGLVLQFLLFGHGGITTVGVNIVIMGFPAVAVGWGYQVLTRNRSASWKAVSAGLLTAAAVALSALIAAAALLTGGEDFKNYAWVLLGAHVPIMVIEGVVAAFVVGFLLKVKPEVLPGEKHPAAAVPIEGGATNAS